MAYLPENARLDNVGVQGLNPVHRNISSIFMPQALQQMDPAALQKHGSYLLPHSKVDIERFLGTTYVNAMDAVPIWWKQIVKIIDTNDINFQLKIWVQKNVVAQPTAPGAPADISEQTQEIRNFTLHRIQTDFKFKNENYQFGGEDGDMEVAMKLGGVQAAVQTAYIRQILESLFVEKDYYKDFKARYSSRSIDTIEDALRWVRDVTFFVQKGGIRGMAEVYGRIRDAIREAGGLEPDTWILPNGFLLTTSIQSFDAVQFQDRGKLIYDHLGRLDESLRTFHGVTMVESPPIKVENESEPIDPLRGILNTGRYFLMQSTVNNLKEYETYKRNVEVYSHATDNERTVVTLPEAISNVARWDEDGYLLSYHYTLAAHAIEHMKAMGFSVPEDSNGVAQVDMFIYRNEDNEYRVADIFGHMEHWNLDFTDVKRTVETGYNSFDRVLNEDDKRALAEGMNVINDLTMFDPMNPNARVFIEALRQSNISDVDTNTGLVEPNLFGFAKNMPTVERNGTGSYVMRVANAGPYITYTAGVVGTTTDLGTAYAQAIPFTPYGMGSIPGMRTLASIARGAEGSVERLGYNDKLLNTARAFDVAFEKVYETMVTHFGEDHISLRADRVPEFWKSGFSRHDRMTLFGTQHFDTPKYPFFVPGAPTAAEPLTEEEKENRANLEEAVTNLRNEESATFLRQFLQSDRAYHVFLEKVEEVIGHPFSTVYSQSMQGKSASTVAKVLNMIVKKLKERDVSCIGLSDGEHVSLRLVVGRTEFQSEGPWNAGFRPRNVTCPHGVYDGDVIAFRNDEFNNNNVPANDVLGTYVVDKNIPPYSPEVSAFGPSGMMDMENMFDDFNEVSSSSDKNYTGTYSSNLGKKYKDISDKYTSQLIKRAYGQMVLLSPTTGTQYQRFMDNDVSVPSDVMGENPQVQYEVKAVIPIRGGGQTVNIYRFAPNFVIENTGIARETKTSFAEYMGAIVRDTRNYTIIPAGWCNHYIKGGDLRPLTPENMNVNTGHFGGSTLYYLLPSRSTKRPGLRNFVQNTQFFTGRYDETFWDAKTASQLANSGIEWGRPTHPSAVYYSFIYNFHEIADRLHITSQTHLPNREEQLNNICFRTQQYNWNDGTGGFTTKILNDDVFGEHGVYTGCAKDRDGNIFKCVHAKTNCV